MFNRGQDISPQSFSSIFLVHCQPVEIKTAFGTGDFSITGVSGGYAGIAMAQIRKNEFVAAPDPLCEGCPTKLVGQVCFFR